ncbi:MAG: hypothetical protein U5K37_09185 [Natrialbaceae archaeon]|nr:hypothetical protein [Natrialbaceae archaeon]
MWKRILLLLLLLGVLGSLSIGSMLPDSVGETASEPANETDTNETPVASLVGIGLIGMRVPGKQFLHLQGRVVPATGTKGPR